MRAAIVALITFGLAHNALSDEFTLILQTKTGHINNAGTDEPVFFALHYMGTKEIQSRDPKRAPRTIPDQKRIEVNLDNEGNDRESGAIDTYKLTFDCPLDKICGVEIGLKSGDDAWYLDGLRYVIETDSKVSEPTSIAFSGWLSAAANDGSKRNPARQFYFFKVKPPKLSDKPPNPKN